MILDWLTEEALNEQMDLWAKHNGKKVYSGLIMWGKREDDSYMVRGWFENGYHRYVVDIDIKFVSELPRIKASGEVETVSGMFNSGTGPLRTDWDKDQFVIYNGHSELREELGRFPRKATE